MATLSARAVRRSDLTTITELPLSRGRRWQDSLNEPGSGELVLSNNDPALSEVADGDLVQLLLDDVVRFAFIARSSERQSIAETSDGETTKLAGPGVLALLDEAVVYPMPSLDSLPIRESRTFSWPAYDYDDSSWVSAVELANVWGGRGSTMGSDPLAETTASSYWLGATMPKWPYNDAWYVWTDVGVTWPLEWAPAGDCYFRKLFTVPSGAVALQWYVLFDAEGELFLDGESLATGDYGQEPNVNTFNGSTPISGGSHVFAARVANDVDPESDEFHNPGALLLVAYAVDAAGGVIGGGPCVISDSSWSVLPYPSTPPGVTPGQALVTVISEAQARDCLPGVTMTFSGTVDSDGTAWPVVGDISTQVGRNVLEFAGELATTYVDVWLDPATLRLNAWVQDARGAARAATLHAPSDPRSPASGNLRKLTHRRVT